MRNKTPQIPDMATIENMRDDSSALYRTLKDLQPLAEALFLIFEYSVNGIYLVDGNGINRYFNRSYEALTGLKRTELIGHPSHQLVESGKVDYSVAEISLQEKRKITQDLFFPLTGKLITISTNLVFNEDGSIYAVIGNLVDITDTIQKRTGILTGNLTFLTKERKTFIENLQNSHEMIVRDEKMMGVLYYAFKAAKSKANILITGETGVGKEEMAKFIHKSSSYRDGPFIQVNCGAIPNDLIESELFGYTAGAFTGASKDGKNGLFEAANHGTIFLDEIAELPYQVQASLLHVLQERKVQKIGSIRKTVLDIRIIAATNQDLLRYVEEKKFREDLYYRINVVPVRIPPLRERKDDILPLCMYFMEIINKQSSDWHSLSPKALEYLQLYRWPGNIRELRNVLERAAALSETHIITEDALFDRQTIDMLRTTFVQLTSDKANTPAWTNVPAQISPPPAEDKNGSWECDLALHLKRYEYEMLSRYYHHFGTIRDASKALHMDRSTFQRKLAAYKVLFESAE